MNQTGLEQILKAHDDSLRALGVDVWVGMEPTFTRRFAQTPQWLAEALGPEKIDYAVALLQAVCKRQPGGIVLHTLGRQYAGEDLPRWSIGYFQARQQQFTWEGPPDPCLLSMPQDKPPVKPEAVQTFWQTLNTLLNRAPNQPAWRSSAFRCEEGLKYRLLLRCDGTDPVADVNIRPQLARDSVHEEKIPLNGMTDGLAEQGDLLLCMDAPEVQSEPEEIRYSMADLVIELPAVPDVKLFVQLMQCISQAANQAGVKTLYFQGFPPPVDETVAWTTITPDPAVIEINLAPAEGAASFFQCCDVYYSAAQQAGLDTFRLQYNGVVSDSGGGGQFTLGGPQPLNSPFLRFPYLLPRLVRYINAHPALSYWFAPPYIGSSSQSPRVDEGVRESFRELSLALEQLENTANPQPEFIWRSLSPFLVDPSGNPHRSELNIEKLWNPYLPGRGCLGLVEFRAFRMARSPQSAAAIAVLLRSVVGMLSQQDKAPRLINHGATLHDQYALPFYLQADLQEVIQDLDDAELSIHPEIQTSLLQESERFMGKAVFHGCYVELRQALEFWPLVGDVASQEGGGSRLVDASTTRLQVAIGVESHHPTQLDGWELWVEGYRVPLHLELDRRGPVKLTGLRYRNFVPDIGLHPGIGARRAINLVLAHRSLDEALQITYHEWHSQGLPYPGLPEDLVEAGRRREERFTARIISRKQQEPVKTPPESALSEYCLDLRWLPD
jgi:uncharacterized protein (DUF2126 family)